MRVFRFVSLVLLGSALPVVARAQTGPRLNQYGNPARITPAATTPAISVRDLQIRLYQFADDSMQGRQVGRIGNMKGTNYIAAEVKRLGLVPAGDNGTYFQVLPYHLHEYTNHSRLTIDGNPLPWGQAWVAVPGARVPRPITSVDVIFGGTAGDTAAEITAQQAAGKFVVLLPGAPAQGRGFGGGGRVRIDPRFGQAAAVATIDLDSVAPSARDALSRPQIATLNNVLVADNAAHRSGAGGVFATIWHLLAAIVRAGRDLRGGDALDVLRQEVDGLAPPATIRLTRSAAAQLLRCLSIDGLKPGALGGRVNASLDFVDRPSDYARNVIAIIPGRDPVLDHEYVAIGAHSDHLGMSAPADHDSLKAFNDERNRLLIANKMIALTPEQLGSIHVNMDSLRKRYPKPRLDSINNGADDDGSGVAAVLEIAEAIQAMPVKPKRSILFVWHTGEEAGLVGSNFFTHNPTVPMDSVVAQINIDMIGRGRAEDVPGGGPNYLGVVGSYFDSKDLGETVAAVNRKEPMPLDLDYRYDSTLAWDGYQNMYRRSDQRRYELAGVPIAFFFTGLHGDYHQLTDEAEYIDYPHLARITRYIKDVTVAVGNGPRPRMNGAKRVAGVVQ